MLTRSLVLITLGLISAAVSHASDFDPHPKSGETLVQSTETFQSEWISSRMDLMGRNQLVGIGFLHTNVTRSRPNGALQSVYTGLGITLLMPVNKSSHGWMVYGSGKSVRFRSPFNFEVSAGLGGDQGKVFPAVSFAVFPLEFYLAELGISTQFPLFASRPGWMQTAQLTLRIQAPFMRHNSTWHQVYEDEKGNTRNEDQ